MAKITKIDVKTSTYQGKEKKSILITLDDGTSGYPTNKDADKSFREGDNVTYTKETKTSGQGKTYNTLTLTLAGGTNQATTPPQQPNNPPPRQPQPTSTSDKAKEWKAKAAISALEFCHSSFDAGKFDTTEKLLTFQKEAVQILWDEIDEIFSER